ncbi:MAG TPA: glycosyltransferase, partial [Herpetosiphonaceae bacterium]|nr:glycosyltransferase [Herpetosiphonaceae bacterium]
MAHVAIIILNYNTRDLLRAAVDSIFASATTHRLSVFVVDNASTDGSADMVASEFPAVRMIKADRNGGFAYGNNLALRELLDATSTERVDEERFVMLLNPDATLEPDSLELLVDYLRAHPAVGAVGPR